MYCIIYKFRGNLPAFEEKEEMDKVGKIQHTGHSVCIRCHYAGFPICRANEYLGLPGKCEQAGVSVFKTIISHSFWTCLLFLSDYKGSLIWI